MALPNDGDSLRSLTVKPGDKITAARHNELIRRVSRMVGESPLSRRAVAVTEDSGPTPFEVSITADGLNYDVTIWPGTVNQYIPSNLFDPLVYDPTTTQYVKLNCTTNTREVTDVEVVMDMTAPAILTVDADAGSSSFDILLAVLAAGTPPTVYQIWDPSNITALLKQQFLGDKASPQTPGTSPYNRWYVWDIQPAV